MKGKYRGIFGLNILRFALKICFWADF